MSIGTPSTLGTLLIQRLDAMLGTTLAQQASIVPGSRPDAISQPRQSTRLEAAGNSTVRHPRQSVDQAMRRTGSENHRVESGAAKPRAHDAGSGTGRALAQAGGTPSAPTSLGPAAKTILALLTRFPDAAPPVAGKSLWAHALPPPDGSVARPSPGPATSGPPDGPRQAPVGATGPSPAMAPGAATDAAPALIRALLQAVQNSGVFYESHLNRLAAGKYGIDDLRREPQGRLDPGAFAPDRIGRAPPGRPPGVGHVPDPAAPDDAAGGEVRRDPRMQIPAASGSARQASLPASLATGLHPDTQLLVRQQFEVLANQIFTWHGEAWPGAALRWEIGRHPDQRTAVSDNESQRWSSRLQLVLPNLGALTAVIDLDGTRINIQLAAQQAAGLLGMHRARLRAQCSARGIRLDRISISAATPRDGADPPGHEI